MKNIIEYYYNLRIDELHNKDDTYPSLTVL